MNRKLSLATRAFLFAFFPMCLMLAGAFFTINATIRAKMKQGLKESMLRTERSMDAANSDYNRRSLQLLEVASEDSGLKAGIGLLREVPYGQKPDAQVLNILKDQMREMAGTLNYDLILLADADGNPVTGFLGKNEEISVDSVSPALQLFPLITLNGTLYEGTTVPINLGAENLGSLILGKRFEIGSPNSYGYAALVYDHKILLTNFPSASVRDLESQLQARCGNGKGDCEIRSGGEDFLTVRVERASLGERVLFFKFQSIDAAMEQFTRGFRQVFLGIGTAGLLLLGLFAVLASRSFSKPITNLLVHLSESEQTGQLRPNFSIHSPVKEVNRLADALNRAAEAIQESQAHLEKATVEFIETMAQALDARDPYTAGHSNRVSVNSTTIAEAMGLSREQVEIIRIGAKLHDIGKIGIPDAVLQKPGRLTSEEYAMIKLHPQIGKRILEKAARFQDYLPIVELHHEDYNGGGYPYGLKGEDVQLGVRIVHVADVYDAITSDRSYRKAMSEEQVMELLKAGSGKQFDPAVLEAFFTVLSQRKVLQMVLDQVGVIHVES